MKINKKQLDEIVDSNNLLIGNDTLPKFDANAETQAKKTTDYNQKIGTQPFRYDMLGRFGFTMMPFFETEGDEDIDINNELLDKLAELMYGKYWETLQYYFRNPNKLKSDFRLHSKHDFDSQPKEKQKIDYDWAKKIIAIIHPYLNDKKNIDESSVVEDKMIEKRNEIEISEKKENDGLKDIKLNKIAGLINKLNNSDKNKLVNLLEINNE